MSLGSLVRPEDNEALKDVVLARIREAGRIAFDEYMALALYHPKLGYYRACDPSLDFQTSPEVHPIFGAMIGRSLADMWRLLERPPRFTVFEGGAGKGRLCEDIVRWATAEAPDFYACLSYVLCDPRIPAMDDMQARLGDAGARVSVATDLPADGSITGCVLSNELLDALPFHVVRGKEGGVTEMYVGAEGRRLDWQAGEASQGVRDYFGEAGVLPGDGCLAEANLAAPRWIEKAARSVERGFVLTFDYGYEAVDLYASWRKQGTILTFHRMSSGDDPFLRVGRQDITASVDFSAIERAGAAAGLKVMGRRRQSEFMGGALSLAAEGFAAASLEGFLGLRRALQVLCEPWGLGRIEVLLQGKGVGDARPAWFEG